MPLSFAPHAPCNQQKVLTLVLTLAMLLSVMVVGAGAAFSDQDSIGNKEAVDVCSTLNIINGYGDGSFRPNGNVTRAEMCKMICVALNGGKDPTFGSNSVATFNDVANDNWAKPYIEYCVSEGIVGGVGGGRFNPDGNITGTQTAKMLLCILGYDASIAGYVGNDSWEMKINVDASAKHLYDGITGIDASAPLTRDQAAQMIWNALQANEVEYVNTFVPGPNGTLISQATVRDKVVGNNDDYITLLKDKYNAYIDVGTLTKIDGNELTISLNDNDRIESDHNGSTLTFSKLTVNYSSLLGEKVKVVTKDGKLNEVMGVYSTDENTVYSTIVNAIDKDGDKIEIDGKSYAVESNGIDVYVNNTITEHVALAQFANKAVSIVPGLTVNNQSADFIKFVDSDNNDKIDTAIVSKVELAKVTYVSSSEIIAGTQTYKTEDHNVASDIAKDDYVAITTNLFDDCKDIVKAQKLTAVSLSGTKTSPNQYQIDGTWYVEMANNADMNGVKAGTTVDAWVYNGVVAYAKRSTGENATLSDICVVVAKGSNLEGDKVKILKLDGSSSEIVSIDTDAKAPDYVPKGDLVPGAVYEYSVRNNEYRFQKLNTGKDFYGDYTSKNNGSSITGTGSSVTNGLTIGAASGTVIDTVGGNKVADSAKIVLVEDYGNLTSGIDFKIITGKQLKTLGFASGANDALPAGGVAAFTSDVDGVTRVTYAVVAVKAIADNFQVNDNYGYVTATSYKAADGYIVYTIWNGTESVTVQEKSSGTRTKGDVIGYSSIDTATEGNIPVINDVSTSFSLVDNGIIRGVNAAGTKISLDGTTQKDITSDTKILYVDTVDHVGYTSGTIQTADKVGNNYIPNVMYVLDGDDVALLVVDQKNKLHGGKDMTVSNTATGADINDALTVADNVTAPVTAITSGSPVTVPAGKTLTLTGTVTDVSGLKGTGNVVVSGSISGAYTQLVPAPVVADPSKEVALPETLKLSGTGDLDTYWDGKSLNDIAGPTGSSTVSFKSVSFSAAQAPESATVQGWRFVNGTWQAMDGVMADGSYTVSGAEGLTVNLLLGNKVEKVKFTITSGGNAVTYTFTNAK